ncbi:hypothetical protein Tco_0803345 [Tanacetum coccineum]|uniref:Uncharacterized protein n=1 Tax=Tanacetum coccineum TaxID=301880 RepID=A0ABQ5A299_9ASTR
MVTGTELEFPRQKDDFSGVLSQGLGNNSGKFVEAGFDLGVGFGSKIPTGLLMYKFINIPRLSKGRSCYAESSVRSASSGYCKSSSDVGSFCIVQDEHHYGSISKWIPSIDLERFVDVLNHCFELIMLEGNSYESGLMLVALCGLKIGERLSLKVPEALRDYLMRGGVLPKEVIEEARSRQKESSWMLLVSYALDVRLSLASIILYLFLGLCKLSRILLFLLDRLIILCFVLKVDHPLCFVSNTVAVDMKMAVDMSDQGSYTSKHEGHTVGSNSFEGGICRWLPGKLDMGFDMVKAAYTRKKKDVERRGDKATAARVSPSFISSTGGILKYRLAIASPTWQVIHKLKVATVSAAATV